MSFTQIKTYICLHLKSHFQSHSLMLKYFEHVSFVIAKKNISAESNSM